MALNLELDCIPAEVLSHDPGCAWPDLGDLFLGACIQYGLFGDSWLAATCRTVATGGCWQLKTFQIRRQIRMHCLQVHTIGSEAAGCWGCSWLSFGMKKHAVMGGNGCPHAQHIYSWPMAKIGVVFLWIYTIEHTRSRSDRFQRFLKRLHPIVCCWSIGFNCVLKLSDPTELNYFFVNCENIWPDLRTNQRGCVSVWIPRCGNKGTRWESAGVCWSISRTWKMGTVYMTCFQIAQVNSDLLCIVFLGCFHRHQHEWIWVFCMIAI